MSSVGEEYDPALGQLQLARMSARQHLSLKREVCTLITPMLEVVFIPNVKKLRYADADVLVNNTIDETESVTIFIFGKPKNKNDRCLSFVYGGFQVDIISIHGLPTAELFYSNNFGMLFHLMAQKTPFSLGTAGFLIEKPLGGKFCLSPDNFKILEFLGIPRTILQNDLTPEELFALLALSPFYDPTRIVVDQRKLLSRVVVTEFIKFCQTTPKSSGPLPSIEEALAFFGKAGEYHALVTEEQRSKNLEIKQANVKKQLLAAINTSGFKGKDVKDPFDLFKAWIQQPKGMCYEVWAQTEPNVAEAFAEFFAPFKKWIQHVKGISYEDWVLTKPNVAVAFAEFGAFKMWIHQAKGISYDVWVQTEPNVTEAFAEYKQ
jgi:hypothetical protein